MYKLILFIVLILCNINNVTSDVINDIQYNYSLSYHYNQEISSNHNGSDHKLNVNTIPVSVTSATALGPILAAALVTASKCLVVLGLTIAVTGLIILTAVCARYFCRI